MHAFSVSVSGDTAYALQQGVEELVHSVHFPFSIAKHLNGAERAPQQTGRFFGVRRQAYKAFYLLSATAIILLLLSMYRCWLQKSKNVEAGELIRELASEDDGKGGEGEAGSRLPELCGFLEERVSLDERQVGIQAPPVQRPAAFFGAVAMEDEKPRKKKRKAKWVKEGAAGAREQTKKARPGERLMGCFLLQLQRATQRLFSYFCLFVSY